MILLSELFLKLNILILLFCVWLVNGQTRASPLKVPDCEIGPLQLSNFVFFKFHGGRGADTIVEICAIVKDKQPIAVNFSFHVHDSYITSNYTRCGDPVFDKMDAVEFYITPVRTRKNEKSMSLGNHSSYLQVDINPYAALWAGYIQNTCNHCKCVQWRSEHEIMCNDSGIIDYSTQIIRKGTFWEANLVIDLNFIHSKTINRALQDGDLYQVDFFRIDRTKDQMDNEKVHYSGWKLNEALEKPCFHDPSAFGYVVISGGRKSIEVKVYFQFTVLIAMYRISLFIT